MVVMPVSKIDYDYLANKVWSYEYRTLSAFTGKPRIDLIGTDNSLMGLGYTSARASKLDYLDARVSYIPAWVWTSSNRYIDGFTESGLSTVRTQFLGENKSLAEIGYTSARASLLDNLDALPKVLVLESPYEGTITANGTEQTLVEHTDTREFWLEGWIDLSNLQAGDTLLIKEYVKVKSGGTYRKYAEKSFSGVQNLTALHILTLPSRYGIKITITQTTGTYRSYDYQVFLRRRFS